MILLGIVCSLLCCVILGAGPPKAVQKKSKLCGNVLCNEVLFTTNVVRPIETGHEAFLTGLQVGQEIQVVAVKFSDRFDIMEGRTIDGRQGNMFIGSLDKEPYVGFLKNAIESKKEMKVISQDRSDIGDKALIGVLQADMDLVRDYNVQANDLARSKGLPIPEQMAVPEPPQKGHGHSHNGHGHSHSGHGHAHDDADGHSHEKPKQTPPPAAQPVHAAQQVPVGQRVPITQQTPQPTAQAMGTSQSEQKVIQAVPIAQQEPVVPTAHPVEQHVPVAQQTHHAAVQSPTTPPPQVKIADSVPAAQQASVAPPAQPVVSVGQQTPLATAQPPATLQPASEVPPHVTPTSAQIENIANESVHPIQTDEIVPMDQMEEEIKRLMERDEKLLQNIESITVERDQMVEASVQNPTPVDVVSKSPTINDIALEPLIVKETAQGKMKLSTLDILGKRLAEPIKEPTVVTIPNVAEEAHRSIDLNKIENPINKVVSPNFDGASNDIPKHEETIVIEPVMTTTAMPVEATKPEGSLQSSEVTPAPRIPISATGEVVNNDFAVPTDKPVLESTNSAAENSEGVCYGDDCTNVHPLTTPLPPSSEPALQVNNVAPMTPDPTKESPLVTEKARDFVDMEALTRSLPPSESSMLSGLVKMVVSTARMVIPGTTSLDDAGVGIVLNAVLFVTFFVIHLCSKFMFEGSDSEVFERRTAHDLATKCKQLSEQMNSKEAEIHALRNQPSQVPSDYLQIKDQIQPLRMELEQLRSKLAYSEQEAARERVNRESLETEREQSRVIQESNDLRAKDAEREVITLKKELQETTRDLKETRELVSRLEKDLSVSCQKNENYEKAVQSLESELTNTRNDLNIKNNEIKELNKNNKQLNFEISTLSEMIASLESAYDETKQELESRSQAGNHNVAVQPEMHRNTTFTIRKTEENQDNGNQESTGGSGGWSDIGDFEEDAESTQVTEPERNSAVKEEIWLSESHTSPNTRGGDIREVARLRALVQKYEHDIENLKAALKTDESTKSVLQMKICALEEEVANKKREIVEKETERKRVQERNDEMFGLVMSSNAKASEYEAKCERMVNEFEKFNVRIKTLEDDQKLKEKHIDEQNADIKKLRNENHRYETQVFSLQLENKNIKELQQKTAQEMAVAKALVQSNTSSDSTGLLPDRETAGSRGPGSRMAYEPLWDDLFVPVQRNRTTSPEELIPQQLKRGTRARRSLYRDPSPSDGERRSHAAQAAPLRRTHRSRSAGRHPFNAHDSIMDYGIPASRSVNYEPLLVDRSLDNHTMPLHSRHSKSTGVYYSSGGSNGGRSPPPEMPLIGAVPPPGIRKPAGKRAEVPENYRSS